MSYKFDKETNEIVLSGWEKGISPSPYDQSGVANIRNLNTTYYPGVVYGNYKRQAATLSYSSTDIWIAGAHSTNVSNNGGWLFVAAIAMSNPVDKAVSPAGLKYVLDDQGLIFKQSAVNSSTFNLLGSSGGRVGNGNKGLAYWNNYIVVFGDGYIEFCGDGTGDAGITQDNWNLNHNTYWGNSIPFTTNSAGAFYLILTNSSDYKIFTLGDTVTFSSTGTLPAPLATNTTYYICYFYSLNYFAVSYRKEDITQYCTGSISSGATSATLSSAYSGTTGTYSVIFSDGEFKSVTLTNGSASMSWSGGLSSGVTSEIHIALLFTDNGTGTHTVTDTFTPLPLGNCTNFNAYFTGSSPYTGMTFDPGTGSFGSYTSPSGESIMGLWKQPSGLYNIIMANGEKVWATFTNGSPTITFASPLTYIGSGSNWQVQLINTSVTNYSPYVSKLNTNLLFANGNDLGELIYVPNTGNLSFSPGLPVTGFSVQNRVVSLSNPLDTIVSMDDLQTNLIIGGQNELYSWDYNSGSVQPQIPITETIKKVWNLLNNIYVLAGQKGNVYVSNGSSAQILAKLPDYIAGVFDPVWTWGDIMTHRGRLFFQALAQTVTGTNILAGIFSLIVSPSVIGEVASGLQMESQNSYGLTPSSGATGAGLLMDNDQSANGEDSYYSAWSNGASTGGIDFNDTTLWSNNESVVETDIIPLGTILTKKTLGNFQFKLDRPMVSGDSISMYWRPSLTDAYQLIGTTTTSVLSDYKPSKISQAQWAQFKVTFTYASSNSSRIPLREIRVQVN